MEAAVLVVAAAVFLWGAVSARLERADLSAPIVFVAVGAVVFALVEPLPTPDPIRHETLTVHLTELVVIVSLMGAGLALDRPVGWRRWGTTWRLLALTMPPTVVAVALLGGWLLGLGAAAAVLLAAVVVLVLRARGRRTD